MRIFYVLLLLPFLFPVISIAQTEYSLGMNRDDEAYGNSPRKATLLTRDYADIPSSHSLKQYCPTIDNQGDYGTCVGWSSAYAARTILEAYQNGWTDTHTITQNAYSAGFLYYHIKDTYDSDCQGGSFPSDAMESMMRKGVPKHIDYNADCPSSISSSVYSLAENHKIQDYATLFEPYASNSIKAQSVKKAIANNNPVVIGMMLPYSFMSAGEKWTPNPSDNVNTTIGGHAMCVIGYDDYKYGGAFEIMNSWGTGWGGQGFTWVTYQDFAEYVMYAYEPIAIPAHVPAIDPIYDLSGELKFTLSNGQEMEAEFEEITDDFGYYRMKDAYSSGTKFRIYITNHQPAFVYAFGSDQTTAKNFTIFPHNSKTSAALNYAGVHVAIPGEEHYIQMDNTIGKDYICVVYSKRPLDIEAIERQVENESGDFATRVSEVLFDELTPDVEYSDANGKIQFKGESDTSLGLDVMAVVIETTHTQ